MLFGQVLKLMCQHTGLAQPCSTKRLTQAHDARPALRLFHALLVLGVITTLGHMAFLACNRVESVAT